MERRNVSWKGSPYVQMKGFPKPMQGNLLVTSGRIMAHTSSRTILRARHALTFDNWIGYIGPIILAVGIAAWRLWRHVSGQREKEERKREREADIQWQQQVCSEMEGFKGRFSTMEGQLDEVITRLQQLETTQAVHEDRFKRQERDYRENHRNS